MARERDTATRVRRIRATEAAQLRALRLRALRDAPEAFSSTWDREAARTAQDWAARAAELAASPRAAAFVAERSGQLVGMAGGWVPEGMEDTVGVWGMWVEPAARRRRLGAALLSAVAAWARASGARRLELAVSERATAAARLYSSMGFTPTGERRAFRGDPAVAEIVLELRL